MCSACQDTKIIIIIPIGGHFLCHRNSNFRRLKDKAYLSVNFVFLSSVLKEFRI